MVSDQIIQVMDAIAEKMGVAINWAADNVMPYVQQLCSRYITYRMAMSLSSVILCAIVTAVLWKVSMFFHKKAAEDDWDCDNPCFWGAIFGWVMFFFSCITLLVSTCSTVNTVITCLTFPEKIILEFVKSFLAAG